ncbi:MAG: LytR C-terminal domain-containing protein [Ilumatobacteraceae bacterium]
MSNDNAGRTGRTARPGRTNGSAPMGSTVAIIVTGIALVLGFLILRKVNDNDTSGGGTAKPNTETTLPVASTIDPALTTVAPITTPPTTVLTLVTTGTKVQVANASTVDGAAGKMSTALGAKAFEMAEAVSASEKLEVSKVLYNADDPAAQPVAASLAALLGNLEIAAQGIPVPVASGTWAEGSGVVLMLGNDYAGKTLAEISGAPTTGTTIAPVTT